MILLFYSFFEKQSNQSSLGENKTDTISLSPNFLTVYLKTKRILFVSFTCWSDCQMLVPSKRDVTIKSLCHM